MTKSVTKLGMEHLKMASLPTIMLSGEMLISYLWFVTEIRKQDDNMQGRTTSSGENEKRIPRVYWDAQDHDAAAMVTGQLAAENVALRVHPGLCRHKVRDEARHRAFEYCIVASDHILTKYVNLKMLTCHWKIAKKIVKKGSIQLFLEAMHNSTWCTVMHGIVCERNEDALGWSVPWELGDVPRSMPSESTQLRTLTKSDTKLGMEHLKMASLPSITVSWNVWHSYACWETEN